MISYFVDLENVQKDGFIKDLKQLKIKSVKDIYYFWSSNCYKPSYEELQVLLEIGSKKLNFVKCTSKTPNAMDFQLVATIGAIIGKRGCDSNHTYYIISNDSGFDVAISTLKSMYPKITIERKQSIIDAESNAQLKKDSLSENFVVQYNRFSVKNRAKVKHSCLHLIDTLNFTKNQYGLVLSAIMHAKDYDEFDKRLKSYPSGQLNKDEKAIVGKLITIDNYENFRN